MAIKLNDSYLSSFIRPHEYENIAPEIVLADKMLREKSGPGNDFLGWVDLPENYDKEEFARIEACAEKIRKTCDVLVVIGIGGSYLGARAVIEFLKSPNYNLNRKGTPAIFYAGNCISADALNEVLELCADKDVCVNVISKSGTTTEPAVAFRVFRNFLEQKYGKDGARERIFVTTDKARGTLKEFSDKAGYETFVVPDDVGGRYSVLTAVGLLPIAVAGIDIDAMMKGAYDASVDCKSESYDKNAAMQYATLRNAIANTGKSIEILVGYEPYMLMLNEWWKQLYGESEGKDKKGIFPASVIFSTDLHSLGQYIQDGQRILFETVLSVKNPGASFKIPADSANVDGLNFLAGKELDFVNKSAMMATLIAHNDGGVPNLVVELDDRSAYTFGYLVYFFEMACAISGYMLGVNPFNQPGVEAYKKNMFALLGKPGYEDMKAELEERINKY